MTHTPRPIRSWVWLAALIGGLAGAGIGALMDQPNSWAWFLAGASLVVLVATALYLQRRQHVTEPVADREGASE